MIYPVLQDFGNLQYICHDVFEFAWKQIGPGSELLVSKTGTDRKDWTIVSKLNVHVTYWKLDRQLPYSTLPILLEGRLNVKVSIKKPKRFTSHTQLPHQPHRPVLDDGEPVLEDQSQSNGRNPALKCWNVNKTLERMWDFLLTDSEGTFLIAATKNM